MQEELLFTFISLVVSNFVACLLFLRRNLFFNASSLLLLLLQLLFDFLWCIFFDPDKPLKPTPYDESLETEEDADEKLTCLLISIVNCSSIRQESSLTLLDLT